MQKVIFPGKYMLQDLEPRREKASESIFKGKKVKLIFLKNHSDAIFRAPRNE
jgi:hypothetical protein